MFNIPFFQFTEYQENSAICSNQGQGRISQAKVYSF